MQITNQLGKRVEALGYTLEAGWESGEVLWLDIVEPAGASALNGLRRYVTEAEAAQFVLGFCYGAECARGDCEHGGPAEADSPR